MDKKQIIKELKQLLNEVEKNDTNSDTLYTCERKKTKEYDRLYVSKWHWYKDKPYIFGYIDLEKMESHIDFPLAMCDEVLELHLFSFIRENCIFNK